MSDDLNKTTNGSDYPARGTFTASYLTVRHDTERRGFASDNYAGVHPDILAAVGAANGGHVSSYGNDPYSAALAERVRAIFGKHAQVFPTLTGTGSNVIALHALTSRHESVVCASTAHVNVDEGGAPERAGVKLMTVDTPDGKLTPDLIDRQAWGWGDQHRSQPRAVTITQSTEMGTVYRIEELRAIVDHAHAKGLYVHLDGARLANAAVSLGVGLREMTADIGIDIVSFGGTKNGALMAEAVIVLNPELSTAIAYLRKGYAQLGSKMRFVSAQLLTLLSDDLWLRNAAAANRAALRLRDGLTGIDGVEITLPVEANAVFARLPRRAIEALQQQFAFYTWDESTNLVRWMTSWDTTDNDVATFVAAVRVELARS